MKGRVLDLWQEKLKRGIDSDLADHELLATENEERIENPFGLPDGYQMDEDMRAYRLEPVMKLGVYCGNRRVYDYAHYLRRKGLEENIE
jgi:hypothetical protein